jgi:hypothetical protein
VSRIVHIALGPDMLGPEAQFGRGGEEEEDAKGREKDGVGGLVARSPYIIIHSPYPAVPRLRTKGI